MAVDTLLRKFLIPEMIYGNGAHQLTGQYAGRFGISTALVVSDPGVVEAGWTGRVMENLALAGITAVPFTEITPNPKDHEVMAGVERYHTSGCDGIVAVGGGSPMDCAKGIGIVCSNGGHILDYEGVDQVPMAMPPLICIPSTAGSAADVSQFAIISDTAGRRKVAIISKSVVPDLALIDPLLTTTMPAELTACTGMDALVHAIEAYVSNASSSFTDLHALHAIRLVTRHLAEAIGKPASLEARNGMMLASTQAGMAFSNASLGAVHAMAHSLGGLLDSPHGECNAQLLEHVIAYNYSSAAKRYQEVSHAMGINCPAGQDSCTALTEGVRTLRMSIGITGTIAAPGVQYEQIPLLAEKAMLDACMVTNPRRPTQKDIEKIYAAAF